MNSVREVGEFVKASEKVRVSKFANDKSQASISHFAFFRWVSASSILQKERKVRISWIQAPSEMMRIVFSHVCLLDTKIKYTALRLSPHFSAPNMKQKAL